MLKFLKINISSLIFPNNDRLDFDVLRSLYYWLFSGHSHYNMLDYKYLADYSMFGL